MSRDFTLIYYSIPEDFDDPEQPNAFGINKAVTELKLRDVRLSFPLEGTYQFRFKYVHNKIPVWMDLSNDDAHVPLFAGKVIAKANRLSWETAAPPKPSPQKSMPQSPPVQQAVPQAVKRGMDIFESRPDVSGRKPVSTTTNAVAPLGQAPLATQSVSAATDYDLLFSQ